MRFGRNKFHSRDPILEAFAASLRMLIEHPLNGHLLRNPFHEFIPLGFQTSHGASATEPGSRLGS